jgi:hypothetical protein
MKKYPGILSSAIHHSSRSTEKRETRTKSLAVSAASDSTDSGSGDMIELDLNVINITIVIEAGLSDFKSAWKRSLGSVYEFWRKSGLDVASFPSFGSG